MMLLIRFPMVFGARVVLNQEMDNQRWQVLLLLSEYCSFVKFVYLSCLHEPKED